MRGMVEEKRVGCKSRWAGIKIAEGGRGDSVALAARERVARARVWEGGSARAVCYE